MNFVDVLQMPVGKKVRDEQNEMWIKKENRCGRWEILNSDGDCIEDVYTLQGLMEINFTEIDEPSEEEKAFLKAAEKLLKATYITREWDQLIFLSDRKDYIAEVSLPVGNLYFKDLEDGAVCEIYKLAY